MLVKTYGAAVHGVNALTIAVEVNLGGSFGFVLVGLPDNAVKEAKERVETAIRNGKLEYPRGRLTINMAPADVRKEGSAYDLTLAVGILAASGQVPAEGLEDYLIMGELGLDGALLPIKGALPIAIQARKEGRKAILLPAANAEEAAIVGDIDVLPTDNLLQAVAHLRGTAPIAPLRLDTRRIFANAQADWDMDFTDVRGQVQVKRALEVAAAGGHNVLLIGPPGAGKTMLAKRLPTILPPMNLHEALETTKIHSVAGRLGAHAGLVAHRPFRAPHHTISDVALVGGGNHPQPGEISLAHHGVLFLDELPEFKRTVLEVMRQPLEERRVTISRARFTVEYPASFMLLASMNPCPCGFYNHPERSCTCPPGAVSRYLAKISGPLLDRIDLHVEVVPVPFEELKGGPAPERSADVRQRVVAARQRQLERFQNRTEKAAQGVYSNAMMPPQLVRQLCAVDEAGAALLQTAMQRLSLSARAYDRILKVARTIADLGNSAAILPQHVAEAIQYRNLDRETWGS